MAKPEYLSGLTDEEQQSLQQQLYDRQSGRCFICDEVIDLVLQTGALDIDHVVPRTEGGKDEENNYALTHASCNRSKSGSDLRVARRMAEFQKLQVKAQENGNRGANLGHVLERYGGATARLRLRREGEMVKFSLPETGDNDIHSVPLYTDTLSKMEYFFVNLPIQYVHHDDRINPRSIGSNVRGLIEEFMKKRPQLHVALAWWSPDAEQSGQIRIFDGQHKAAAQILLGVKDLPVRVFLNPDTDVLLVTNTNAGEKLRQVAFDKAVMRHLGSTLYAERVRQYQQMKGLEVDDYSFSEEDLTNFFKGEKREMLRYIIDATRDAITHNKENRLMEFVEWSGKGAQRPLSYSSIERTFFAEFLHDRALRIPIDEGMDRGENPRLRERNQMVRFMSLFADTFFVGHWDPEIGGRKLENKIQKGELVPELHVRAWRVAREEILASVLRWVRGVIEHYFSLVGAMADKDRLMQAALPEQLWEKIEVFLQNLAELPCWVDRNLSTTVFGAKQNRDFWKQVFETGKTPSGVRVLGGGLNLLSMIEPKVVPK